MENDRIAAIREGNSVVPVTRCDLKDGRSANWDLDNIGSVSGAHMGIHHIIRKAFNLLGLEIHRYRPAGSEEARLVAMLSAHGVNLVFDVGANVGQFAMMLRKAGYGGRIVSFEALSTAYEQLLANRDNDPLWDVAPRAAIGGEDGEVEVHLSGNSVSSSVLNMLDAHKTASPGSAYVGSEMVPLRRLDALAPDYLRSGGALFIKIDTQGYEDRVLQGATGILDRAVGVQLELSLVPLYSGQKLYREMQEQLEAMGFELWGMTPEFVDPTSGRLLQINATYFRPYNVA